MWLLVFFFVSLQYLFFLRIFISVEIFFTLNTTTTLNFKDFNMAESLMEGIAAMNYQTPTPVQQQVIPEILAGNDLIGCAQTGTGKTAAFLLPMIHILSQNPSKGKIRAMIVVPTRELAVQISQQAEGFGYFSNISSIAIYGGGDGIVYTNEKRALTSGVDIIICTPGRMISHFNMGYVDMDSLEFLVLDEADRMLDMGFFDDIMKMISFLPKKRQSLLFSATMPPKIRDMARKILQNPLEINISLAKPPEKIKQLAYMVFDDMKIGLVKEVVKDPALKTIIIFCDTKSKVKQLTRDLKSARMQVEEIHSDLEQKQREDVMNRFKSRQTRILVATDIISRGIDVDNIDLVVNFNVPHDAEDYVHRIGRTARAEALGQACTLVGPKEQRQFAAIEKLLGKEVPRGILPDSIGKSPEYRPFDRQAQSGGGRFGSSPARSNGNGGAKKKPSSNNRWRKPPVKN